MRQWASTFVQSFFMIIVTELGDKTFFIAAILAMRAGRLVVFAGAITALAIMTVLSSILGVIFPALLPPWLTNSVAAILFGFFGIKLLREGYAAADDDTTQPEELKEAEEALSKKHDIENPAVMDAEGNIVRRRRKHICDLHSFLSPVLLEAFAFTFSAEWGDRSQIATITLAAAQDPYAVTLGGILGHCMCTGLAVISGRMLAARISPSTVSYLGGVLFCLFAILTVLQPHLG
eukprot:NODE_1205_length_956_cov_109.995175_g1160_i0.p1 GENE.NODE_1205_length_956_cov_109.995175_g1160_i0~~NODE_1205_length_956_cov_109.995175_g1160_i0.p1  ORF type:complete len:234 (-),score=31.99 NODE_1205_length_956_cov_109.995175_g1160_i0:35-736(-)